MLQKSLIGVGALLTLTLVGAFAPVQATSQQAISIPVSTEVTSGVSAGEEAELESASVDSSMVGMTCKVEARSENQTSVHLGNDLIVRSGDDSITLKNVEREGNGITTTEGTLTLGNTITVSLIMGSDEKFSAGMTVTITCEEPEPTVVSGDVSFNDVCGIEDDTFTVEETDGVSYDVDDQRVDGVGTVTVTATADDGYELDGDSEWSFDFTNETCEQPTEEICRDGEIITINPDDRQETDTDAPCEQGESDTPEQLPNTGIGAVATTVVGSTSIFAGVRSWAKSRSQMKDVLSNR